jgi:hypothetical protein
MMVLRPAAGIVVAGAPGRVRASRKEGGFIKCASSQSVALRMFAQQGVWSMRRRGGLARRGIVNELRGCEATPPHFELPWWWCGYVAAEPLWLGVSSACEDRMRQ